MKNHATIAASLLLITAFAHGLPQDPVAADAQSAGLAAAPPSWPRTFEKDGNTLVMYQPQVDSWDKRKQIRFRSAITLTQAGSSEQHVGVVAVKAQTTVDHDARLVLMTKLDVAVRFPGLTPDKAAPLKAHGQGVPAEPRLPRRLARPRPGVPPRGHEGRAGRGQPRAASDPVQLGPRDPRHLHGAAGAQADQGHVADARREHQLAGVPGQPVGFLLPARWRIVVHGARCPEGAVDAGGEAPRRPLEAAAGPRLGRSPEEPPGQARRVGSKSAHGHDADRADPDQRLARVLADLGNAARVRHEPPDAALPRSPRGHLLLPRRGALVQDEGPRQRPLDRGFHRSARRLREDRSGRPHGRGARGRPQHPGSQGRRAAVDGPAHRHDQARRDDRGDL